MSDEIPFEQPHDLQLPAVSSDMAGQRLDVWLAGQLHLSRGQANRLIEQGMVRLDGRRGRKGMKLAAAQRVEIATPLDGRSWQLATPRPDLTLVGLGSGEGWIAIDKPAGLAVHPLNPLQTDTVLNAAIARYPQLQGVGEGGLRSGVVHRLDIDTSGVLLLATRQDAWSRLRDEFRSHHTRKIYRAIVAGNLTGRGRLVRDLVVAQHSPARVKVVEADVLPKPAGTRRCDLTWRSITTLRDATVIDIELGTGFLHQIRVMMAHINHPVLGDKTYGPTSSMIDLPRQMLHARFLQAGPALAESPIPHDFLSTIDLLQ